MRWNERWQRLDRLIDAALARRVHVCFLTHGRYACQSPGCRRYAAYSLDGRDYCRDDAERLLGIQRRQSTPLSWRRPAWAR